jgi:hypothetical protein
MSEELTHMGQKASRLVVLESFGGSKSGCDSGLGFTRILPDGGFDAGPDGTGFRIPQGMVLIITDVDWSYVHPTKSGQGGKIQTLRLFIQSTKDPSKKRRAFESTVILSSAGEGGISESMTTGFAVASSARICPDVFPGPTGPPSGLQHITLRGYLAPAS